MALAPLLLVGVQLACRPPVSATLPAAPTAVCQLRDPRITEASGIVPSYRNPGLYYVHNDSGDEPRVYLVDRDGRTRVTVRLRGATAIDYEDISLAPGTTAGLLDVCVADIGDNENSRAKVAIYRFAEIDASDPNVTTVDVAVAAYRARYADGPANAEAFCVQPRTGDGYILTKRIDGQAYVYKLAAPWNDQETVELARLTTIHLPPGGFLRHVVTAADIAPDGRKLAVRCYVDGWEWRLPTGATDRDFDHIFDTSPVRLSLPTEPQGEGLCYSPDGQYFLTVSEGAGPTLWETPAPKP
jgi:hypothetical protein